MTGLTHLTKRTGVKGVEVNSAYEALLKDNEAPLRRLLTRGPGTAGATASPARASTARASKLPEPVSPASGGINIHIHYR